MPSVAARILTRLQARLLDIRGQGAMVHDLQGRVYLRRPTYDVDAESLPAVFLVRRPSSGTTREQRPGASSTLSTTTVIFDAIGLVRADEDSGLQAEHLLADMQRALERPGDVWLMDCGKNLLSQELQLVSVELAPFLDDVPYDLVGVGVQCTYPHKYGDPDHVE